MDKIIGKVSFPLGQEERLQPVESVMTRRGDGVELSVSFQNGTNKGILAFGFTLQYYDAQENLLDEFQKSVKDVRIQSGEGYGITIPLPGNTEYGLIIMNFVIFDDNENWYGERRAEFATYERIEKEAAEYLSGSRSALPKQPQQPENKETVVTPDIPNLNTLEKAEEQIPEPEKNQKTVTHLSVMFAVLITAFAVTCEYFFLRGSGSAMAATSLLFLALSVANIQRKPLKVVLYLLCSVVTIGNLYLAVGTQWSELINWSNVFLALIPMSIAIFQKKRRHLVLGIIFTVLFALSLLSTAVQLLNMSYEMIIMMIQIVGVIGFVFLFALWASINLISQKRTVQITGGIITIVLAVVLFVFETNVYQGLFKELNSSSIQILIMLYATVCFLFLAALFAGSISIVRGIMLKDKISNHR